VEPLLAETGERSKKNRSWKMRRGAFRCSVALLLRWQRGWGKFPKKINFAQNPKLNLHRNGAPERTSTSSLHRPNHQMSIRSPTNGRVHMGNVALSVAATQQYNRSHTL
jgi:hypothetical protein